MAEKKYYSGIETGKKFNEYTERELDILPPIPKTVAGVDYPSYYKEPPLYWVGYKWELIFE